MAITIEELKVGDSCLDVCGDEVTLLFKNERMVLLGSKSSEYVQTLESFLRNYSLKPKPKKMIEFVMFTNDIGLAIECEVDTVAYRNSITSQFKRISSRTIEVEE